MYLTLQSKQNFSQTKQKLSLNLIWALKGGRMSKTLFLFLALLYIFLIPLALSQNLPKQAYEQHYKSFNAGFHEAMQHCATLKYKAQRQCEFNTLANRELQKATIKATLEPTIRNRYHANMLKAEINYNLACNKCQNLGKFSENVCLNSAKNHHAKDAATAKAQRNVEMNQTILRNKDLLVERFNSRNSPFVSTDLKRPSTYRT